MKKTLLMLMLPSYLFSQTHSVDNNVLFMSGNDVNSDIAINTFYNSIDTCDISWNIIYDSLPTNWEFSICFPDCNNIGIVSGSGLFLPNEKSYLNCHMYPNGAFGEGVVQMEIVTNNMYRDTITWYGQVKLASNTEDLNPASAYHKLIKITDVYGRDVTDYNNKLLLYIYSNGKVEKKINLK